ncbi:hypothetical protein ACOSQ4_006950 [Xanthoceras sorbifolium]
MGTQNETNAEFRNEVHEILGRHESSIEEVHATLQTVLTELQWFAKLKGPVTWIEFTKALLLRFGPTDYEDPSEALTRLKQTTTVSAYEEEFEKLSHRVNELPENFLVGSFIAGLKNDIRLDVKIKQPRSLTDAIGVARFIEERNRLQKKRISAFRSSIFGTQPKASNSNPVGILGPSPVSKPVVGNNGSPTPFKIITSREARERQEKGLYYYCDERFKPGHRCERPQLFMIEDTEELVEETLESLANQQRQEELPEISFHAITGTTHPQTIRLQGRMKGKEVIMLVDGGSTHNFVDQS